MVVTVGVVGDLLCAEAVSDTFAIEVLTGDIRVDVLIIVSNVAVDLLMDALTEIKLGVVTNIDIGVLVDVDVKVFAEVMAAFEFAMPDS